MIGEEERSEQRIPFLKWAINRTSRASRMRAGMGTLKLRRKRKKEKGQMKRGVAKGKNRKYHFRCVISQSQRGSDGREGLAHAYKFWNF